MKSRIVSSALLCLLSIVGAFAAQAVEPATSLIGKDLQVFPGDKFYMEGEQEQVPVLELASTFESRMPGSLRIPFSFAIDSKQLRWIRDDGTWRYFAAPQGKARAWHGLIGNVLANGDTVGIRIRKSDGLRQWFVDNSRHNNMNTIWSRKVDVKKDVAISSEGTEMIMPSGGRLRGLEYLGVRDNQLRIRYEEFGDAPRQEEFLFPIEAQMPMLIGVMGLRAEVSAVSGASARIKIVRGFNSSGFAHPAQ